jgi:nitrate reductase NapE component
VQDKKSCSDQVNQRIYKVCVMDMAIVVLIFSGKQFKEMCASLRDRQQWNSFAYYKVLFFFILSVVLVTTHIKCFVVSPSPI